MRPTRMRLHVRSAEEVDHRQLARAAEHVGARAVRRQGDRGGARGRRDLAATTPGARSMTVTVPARRPRSHRRASPSAEIATPRGRAGTGTWPRPCGCQVDHAEAPGRAVRSTTYARRPSRRQRDRARGQADLRARATTFLRPRSTIATFVLPVVDHGQARGGRRGRQRAARQRAADSANVREAGASATETSAGGRSSGRFGVAVGALSQRAGRRSGVSPAGSAGGRPMIALPPLPKSASKTKPAGGGLSAVRPRAMGRIMRYRTRPCQGPKALFLRRRCAPWRSRARCAARAPRQAPPWSSASGPRCRPASRPRRAPPSAC